MKIKKSGLSKNLEQNKNSSGKFISEVIDRIFLICLEDQTFDSKEKLKLVEKETIEQNKKVEKQEKLLNDALKIKNTLKQKLLALDEEITSKKEKILESLGSEL